MEIKELLNLGVAVGVLAWVLWKLEPALEKINTSIGKVNVSINRQSQLFLILLNNLEASDQSNSTSNVIISGLRKDIENELEHNGK